MPVNEFEKQVQQIMEELKLPPTPPVWENIEEQIRKKKDRRRIIFLVLFFFLILAGGSWLMIGTGNKRTKQNAKMDQIHQGNSATINPSGKNQKAIIEKQNEISSLKNNEPNNRKASISVIRIEKERIIGKTERKTTVKSSAIKKPKQWTTTVVTKSQDQSMQVKQDKDQDEIKKATSNQKEDKQTEVVNKPPSKNDQPVKTESVITNEIKQPLDRKQNADSIDEPTSSVAITTPEQKKNIKTGKWQKQVTAEMGLSNYGYGFLGGGQQSYATLAIGSPGPPFTNPVNAPQGITKGPAFAIGFQLTKPFNKRFEFSFGLQYHYFSTHTKTGAVVKKDSSVRYGADMIAISEYYKNGDQANYTNRFHVLELPVSIQYRVSKNFPLDFGLGFSYGHLLKTNALSFNSQANIYYRNKKDYSTNYLNLLTSLQYSWLQKTKFSIRSGPIFSYSITQLQRSTNDGSPHLFSVGIQTSIKF